MDILISGAATSSIYALMAIGVTLIFGVARVVNFSHGAFYTLGAYFMYWATATLGLPLWAGILLSCTMTGAIAIAIDKWLISPIRQNIILVWMLTFALAFVIREVIVLSIGSQPLALESFWPGTLQIFDTTVERQRIGIIIVAIACLSALWIFLKMTRYGAGLRAVAQNETAAALMGISVRRSYALIMALSAGLAAIAGFLIAPLSIIEPDMGLGILLMAFTVVILGGIGSVGGTLLASVIIGYGETLVSYFISPQLVTVFALGTVFAVLLVSPVGIAGLPIEERA